MTAVYAIDRFIDAWATSPFGRVDMAPWLVVQQAEQLIRQTLSTLGSDYKVSADFGVHRSAIVEEGAILKGPGVVGPGCFVAAGAYLRGGTYLGEGCTIGPGSELKTSFMFPGSKLAHLNFVGDSIIGSGANIEAGAMIANYRNELADKKIRIVFAGEVIDTDVIKFGSLIGDNVRIGANAVVAPGALIPRNKMIGRLQLIDQYPYEQDTG
ncbi:DapH/DapD/GlmU-related protein [Sphingomonas rubra]|uniref:Transferase hexapeptide (Six repeat-containing protein) n=1 Tax=Sphingomonas rubra TaxID=634430 RepID=A0A1I5PX19_9SPHN|nr:transferase [Sphingomonas rubra]SFP38542.1 transferase hexapeptide (six repeat-containing protein) [Sphingomonas rubra]